MPAFALIPTATGVELATATSGPDLAVQSVTFTPSIATTGQNLTVSFTVKNLGSVAATGTWSDSVYLSATMTLTPDAVLLGRVTHNGPLAPVSSYNGTLTAPVPGVVDGTYYVLVVADSGMQVNDSNRANNTAAAATGLPVQAVLLSLGSTVTGTIADGQAIYCRINVAQGTNVKLAATFATTYESEFLVRYNAEPTLSTFDESSDSLTNLTPVILLPGGLSGSFYILLNGESGAGTGQSFTLLASKVTFELDGFDIPKAANVGKATMHLTGAGFTPLTSISLHGPQVITPLTTTFVDSNHLTVTFDLTGHVTGNYTVQAQDGMQMSSAPGMFQIVLSSGGGMQKPLSLSILSPATVSIGAQAGVSGSISNNSLNDVQLPVFAIQASSTTPTNYLIGDGILGPGQTQSFGHAFLPAPDVVHTKANFSLVSAPPAQPINWMTDFAANRPVFISSDAWTAILSNLATNIGSTQAELQTALQNDADYFAQLGESVTDQADLLNFEEQKADDMGPVPVLAAGIDSGVSEPGDSLTFQRSFLQPIAGRNRLARAGPRLDVQLGHLRHHG